MYLRSCSEECIPLTTNFIIPRSRKKEPKMGRVYSYIFVGNARSNIGCQCLNEHPHVQTLALALMPIYERANVWRCRCWHMFGSRWSPRYVFFWRGANKYVRSPKTSVENQRKTFCVILEQTSIKALENTVQTRQSRDWKSVRKSGKDKKHKTNHNRIFFPTLKWIVAFSFLEKIKKYIILNFSVWKSFRDHGLE